MRAHSLAYPLGALLSTLPIFGLANPEPAHAAPLTLRPISINQFEAATGIHRRSAQDFSHLDLQAQAQLIYGSPGGKCMDVLGASQNTNKN